MLPQVERTRAARIPHRLTNRGGQTARAGDDGCWNWSWWASASPRR